MKKIAFITPADSEYGFGLAGISQYCADEAEAEKTLLEVMADAETGMIILDERTIHSIDEDRLRGLEKRWQGILIVLPSPVKPATELEDYAARLIRRAVGYHVRLKL